MTRPLMPMSPYQEGSWNVGSHRMRVSRLRYCWPDERIVAAAGSAVVAMNRQDIDELRSGLLLVGVKLLQQPGIIVSLVVRVVIGIRRAGSVRLVESADVHRPPAPLLRADDLRVRIGGSDGGGVGHDLVVHLLVGGRVGVNVAMRGIPQRRLVVEDVIFDAGGR